MKFWFFGKRDDQRAHERIDEVHKLLKNSFKNVKFDISELGSWQKSLEESHQEHKSKINELSKKLIIIEKQLNEFLSNSKTKKEVIEEEFIEENSEEENQYEDQEVSNGLISILTTTQTEIFIKIYQLQKQVGSKISYKSLAAILYRDKDYNNVRSTLSEYTSLLVEQGLVQKYRKGKEIYVGLTNRGIKFLQNLQKSRKIDSKNKSKT